MRIDYDIAMEVASHEAIVRQAYKDSVGKWTWSVGLTSATGHIVERYIGKPQSLAHCLRVYAWALDNYADAVRKAFEGVALTKAQFAAALSFHWNTGAIGRATWVKHFRAGKLIEAERAFLTWNKPPEIKGRRQKEADLLFRGRWSNDGRMTEWTHVRANGSIDWSKSRRLDVSKELRAALAGEVPASDKVIEEKPVMPVAVETEVKRKTGLWGWIIGVLTGAGTGTSAIFDAEWPTILAVGGVGLVIFGAGLIFRHQILRAVKEIRESL